VQRSEWLRVAAGERGRGNRKGLNRKTAIAKLRRKTAVSSWIATPMEFDNAKGMRNWTQKQRLEFLGFVLGYPIVIDLKYFIPQLSCRFLLGGLTSTRKWASGRRIGLILLAPS